MQTSIIINVIIMFIIAFTVSSICILLVIQIAEKKKLYNATGGRHIHNGHISRLGGIAIFAGLIFSQVYFFLDIPSTESFYGLFGVEVLPLWFSYLFSIFVITFFVNAYNLIDGLGDKIQSSSWLLKK